MKQTPIIFAMILGVALNSFAQITSTFNTDAEGWTLTDNNNTDPQTVNYFSTGGNPGGYISATKTSSSQPYFWTSPSKFGGNIMYFSYGQDLKFDLQINHVASVHGAAGDVQIRTPSGSVLAINLPTFPAQAPGWSSYSIRLDETAGWHVGSIGGPVATQEQVLQYLSGVASFKINIKYNSGVSTFTGAIDNVILNQRSILPSPTISSLSLTSGNPGTSIIISGSNFDPIATNNGVYFGGVAATITNASVNSLTVTVPNGAQYGPITIVNKTTSRSKTSLQPFTPTFTDGGRIVPASFAPKFDLALSDNYGGLNIADIDGDGWNDLVVANRSGNSLTLYRNLGNGGNLSAASFAAPVNIPGVGNQLYLYLKDLDNDGKLDIVSNYSTGFVMSFATLRNTSSPGSISFEAAELWTGLVYSGFISEPFDVDGDGLIDLIAQHGNGSSSPDLWIAQNLSIPGDILFATSISYFGNTLDAGAGVSHRDLDGDGKPDLIIKSGFGNSFSIAQNNSVPGVISFATPVTFASAASGGNIAIADFNLDGKNDLAWKNGFANDDVHIRLNTDLDGILTTSDFATEIILNSEVSNYGKLSLADVNGDGRVDIIATDNADVGIFENVYSSGVFDATAFIPGYQFQGNGGSTYPEEGQAADLNGDNRPDIVVGITNTSPNRLSIYENKNTHTPVISLTTVSPLKGPVGSTVTITGNYFSTTASENLVHFGAVEASVVTATKTQLTVTVPAGATYAPVSVTRDQFTASYHLPFNTTFSAGVSFNSTHFATPVSFTLTGGDYDINVSDLNEDGKPDILVEANTNKVYAFRNTYTSGAINSTSLMADDSVTVSTAQNPRVIDLNGDNKPDFVATNGVFRNISSGAEINFEAQTNIGGVTAAALADFNLDGKTDYVGTLGSFNVSVFENRMRQGTGAFISGGNYNSLSTNFDFAKPAAGGGSVTADFDNDGFMDMACGNGSTDNMTVWRNNGSPRLTTSSFTSVGNLATLDNPGRLYTGDMDVDGKVDIVLYYGAGTSSSQISIFHNTSSVGSISFNRVDYSIPATGTLAWISDLDGDGKPEILVTSETTNQFFIIKNASTPGLLNASSFAAPFATAVTGPRGLATADINLDGKPEIIINTNINTLLVYENLVPTIAISITQQPASPYYACEGSSASLTTAASGTTNIAYQWQRFDGFTFVDLVNNSTFGGVTTPTLTVNNVSASEAGEYQCVISGDFAPDVITDAADLVFNSLPSPPDVINGVSCGPGGVTLTASGGSPGDYQWYTGSPLTPISGEVNDTYDTPLLNTNTDYYVSLRDTFCESVPVVVTAIISAPPAKPTVTANISPVGNVLTICSNTVLTVTAPTGFANYYWFDDMGYPFGFTQQITVNTSSTYRVQVLDTNGCASEFSDDILITVVSAPCTNSAPVISSTQLSITVGSKGSIDLTNLISDADNNVVLTSLAILQQPTSGAQASIVNNTLELDYTGINFTGTESITIQVCDAFGECSTQQLLITVIGELEIYNAVSPNGDNLNDFFRIEYIDLIPDTQQNKVVIYNRWGSKVFEVENYNNADRVFKGLNLNGGELPSGTYFYKIEFRSGKSPFSGYLVLKR